MNIGQKIETCEANIYSYREMLKMMPEDTLLGRLCVNSLIKKEERKREKLIEKYHGVNG